MENCSFFNRALLMIFLFFAVLSCSKDDPEEETEPINLPASINLEVSESTQNLQVGDVITFDVNGSNGQDYTSQSSILLDGDPIAGTTYTFNKAGTHFFQAKLQTLISNGVTIVVTEKGQIEDPQSISLTADREAGEVDLNEEVTFTVTGNNSLEYTGLSEISLNGEVLSGNTYSFQEAGEYVFEASYGTTTSNTLTFNVKAENFVAVNRNRSLRNQEVTFQYFGEDGQDHTEEAEFYVNGSPINNNVFSTGTTGEYEVYAVHNDGSTTASKTFEIFEPVKKVLFEDYTGTWCGWCPRVTNAILELEEATDDLVTIGIHLNDEMEIAQNYSLASFFEIEALPHARFDRSTALEYPEDEPEQLQRVLNAAGNSSPYTIAIDTKLEGDQLHVEVKIMAETIIPEGYKLVVYILQNGVIFPQVNYLNNDDSSRWHQQGDPIEDFVHDNVLEVPLTEILGDPLNTIEPLQESIFTFDPVDLSTLDYSGYGNYYNPSKFEVVAFITDENNTALNARRATAGKNAEYE